MEEAYKQIAKKHHLVENPPGSNNWYNPGGVRFYKNPLGFRLYKEEPIKHVEYRLSREAATAFFVLGLILGTIITILLIFIIRP